MVDVKNTDSIPRASVEQIIDVLAYVASAGRKSTFEQVRLFLAERSQRKAPGSRTAMWTVARDILSDLQKMGLMNVGALPRKQSHAHRYADSPCEMTERGVALTALHKESRGRAFDELLLHWMNEHAYFRVLICRLHQEPLFVPEITSIKEIGVDGLRTAQLNGLAERITDHCLNRLEIAHFANKKVNIFTQNISDRVQHLQQTLALTDLDAKRWVDTIQDKVVTPAFLAAESLPFDMVTFQHLLKAAKEFYAASWTTSHPDYALRVIFPTCEFRPDIVDNPTAEVCEVIHHGKAFACKRFTTSLAEAYRRLAGSSAGYVDAYKLRALVCVDLQIQPQVFAACLKELIHIGSSSEMTIYTELPFDPPPQGEEYLQIGQNRIGLLKLTFQRGGQNGA